MEIWWWYKQGFFLAMLTILTIFNYFSTSNWGFERYIEFLWWLFLVRGVIKNVDNIKIESSFCLIHIGELFLVRKMVKMEEDRNENWAKP